MNIIITIEVQVSETVEPKQVVDEMISNVESCDWTVVSTFYEIVEGADHADD